MSRYKSPVSKARKVVPPGSEPWQFRPPPWHEFRPPPFDTSTSWGASSAAKQSNRQVASELVRARLEPQQSVDPRTREAAESITGADLRGVRVHSGPASDVAATSLDARAFTVGSDIHLSREAAFASSADRREILTHELVHAAQQGNRPVALNGTLPVSDPSDHAEEVARAVAKEVVRPQEPRNAPPASPALRLRDQMRVTPVAPSIQRDIKGTKKWPQGTLEIDFTKSDAATPGTVANEDGSITFTPSAAAPDSNEIHFFQVLRFLDTGTGAEAPLGATPATVRTKGNAAKNVAPGFFVDEIYSAVHPRTKKADPVDSPFYDAPPTPAGTVLGKKKGKTIVPAVLTDRPQTPNARHYEFVTSAKGRDTGIGYGTVLWGFETFHDKAGVTRIRNEYHSFRIPEGETAGEALRVFNEFARNPGSSTAPTK